MATAKAGEWRGRSPRPAPGLEVVLGGAHILGRTAVVVVLRPVHQEIGALDRVLERLAVLPGGRPGGEAERRPRMELVVQRQQSAVIVERQRSALFVRPRQQQRELVAADARRAAGFF